MSKEELKKLKGMWITFLHYVNRYLNHKKFNDNLTIKQLKEVIQHELDIENDPKSIGVDTQTIMKIYRG